MIKFRNVDQPNDEGSLIIALLGVVVMTSVVTIGFATVLNGQQQTRHDQAFAQALTGAESGLDSMAAQVKASPSASSFTPISSSSTTNGVTVSYAANATGSSGSWVVDSVGTATVAGKTVSREVQENVTLAGIYGVPLFGDTALTLGSGSGVNQYDSGSTGAATANSCSVLPNTGVLGLLATTVCTPTIAGTAAAATDGGLTVAGSDLNNFSQINIDNANLTGGVDPDLTGTCVGDSSACASSKVVKTSASLDYPDSTVCSSGVGANAAAITGSNYLAAGAVYNLIGDLTLNAAVTANLGNLASTGVTLCFNSNLFIPSLGAAGVTVPWNSTISSAVPLQYTPRPPVTLQFIDTATSSSASTIYIGDGLNPETALSAVIYAPHANCVVSGHLDLYGSMVCGSISAPNGISVHYDTQLKASTAQQTVAITNWREVH